MRTLFLVCLCVAGATSAMGQALLQENLLILADDVPAPPSDVAAAFARMDCRDVNLSTECSVDKYYRDLTERLTAARLQLEELNLALAMPAGSGLQNLNAEEIQAKLVAMTPEEQMRFAMEMSAQMGGGARAMAPEPGTVMTALDAYNRMASELAMAAHDPDAVLEQRLALLAERDRRHAEVDEWTREEHARLPIVSFGEAGKGPQPKAEYALRTASLDRHIAVENDYLAALQAFWPHYRDHLNRQHAPFQDALAAAGYGAAAGNPENRRLLVGGQGYLLGPAETLMALSREATTHAAEWVLRRTELESSRPRD